jgi:hypothetical protein
MSQRIKRWPPVVDRSKKNAQNDIIVDKEELPPPPAEDEVLSMFVLEAASN